MYHPPSQKIDYFFKCIGRALDVYNDIYDKFLLVGDFNAEENELVNFWIYISYKNKMV